MQQWSPALPAALGQGDPLRCQEQSGPGHRPSHLGPRGGGGPGEDRVAGRERHTSRGEQHGWRSAEDWMWDVLLHSYVEAIKCYCQRNCV